ncbi:MAG: radical SAM family heme chaperone HemW [Gammaproteobacteria bacterium]|nr:radical SAM family heme chaperone HemW [Gammaproteobacteria bacterium]
MSALTPAQVPLALYIHLPWCVRKCPYCDFNSHTAPAGIPEDAYVAALLDDLAADLRTTQGRPLSSVFIGGGTPSLFSGAAIGRLMDGVRAQVALPASAEVTLEANPGTVDAANFAGYRAAGVNRLSIGVQSLRPAQLQALGRIHSPADVTRAVATARAAGFDNFNLDLMHGLPGDAPGDALADLRGALAFRPTHLSWYQLTIEAGTAFAQRPPVLPDDEAIAEDFDAGCALLEAAGFTRYEVSAYARAGHESRHNLNYWTFGDYLGIGAGAHGKLTHAQGIVRTLKRRHPQAYLKAAGQGRAVAVPAADLVTEFMLNALRLRAGFSQALFTQRTGLTWQHIAGPVATGLARGWLTRTADGVAPSVLGYRFLSDLQLLFMDGDAPASP